MTSNMNLSCLGENVIITKITVIWDGTIPLQWQMVPNDVAPNMVQDHKPTNAVWYRHKMFSPMPLLNRGRCGLSMVGNWVVKGFILGFILEQRGIEWDLILYVGQLELAKVPYWWREHWPSCNGLLDGPCDVLDLPTHYREVVHTDVMNCGVDMVIDGWRSPEVFPEPFPVGPCRFPYVLLIPIQSVTLVPADYSAFLHNVVPVLEATRRLGVSLWCSLPWNGHRPPLCHKCSWSFHLNPWCRYHHINVVVVAIAATVLVGGVVLGLGDTMFVVAVDLGSVESPVGILTP